MANMILPSKPEAVETVVEMGRLGALSDGVYAIALTLLVLDIKIPESTLAGDLSATLVALAPKLLIYLISFVVIGGAWGSHQRMLSQIKRGSGLLVWFNLLSLLFITILPATASLLGRFPTQITAILCFAVNVILIQVTAFLLWRHAYKNGLLNPALDPRIVKGIDRRLLLSAAAFGLSIPIAFLNPVLGYVLWVGLFILIFATDWLSWQQNLLTSQAVVPLDNAARADVHLEHGGGQLTLHAGAPKDMLVAGTFGGGLDSQSVHEGDLLKNRLSVNGRRGFMSLRYPWAWDNANSLDWDVSLNSEIPLALTIETSAGQSNLDLSELRVNTLNLEINASSATLTLPTQSIETKVKISSSLSSSIIKIPSEAGAHIYIDKPLANLEIDLNRFTMLQNGREYRSVDYETAANHIDIQVDLTLSSMKII
jgi:uncharacterized membrane protein